MSSTRLALMLLAATALASCEKKPEATAEASPTAEASTVAANDPIASAESAAPATVAHAATIVTLDADGKMTELRKGTNGFTCMPDNPKTPGPDPMCMDANAMEWAMAWLAHATPPEKPGFMYMLAGGTDASNTDPYATEPTADNHWIETGPHVMVVGSKAALAGYPATADPDTKAPYVMFPNTPYAHLMIPVG